jgi:hypothetical protein
MIAAKKEWCNVCQCEHIEGNHIEKECEDCKMLGWTCAICEMTPPKHKPTIDLQFLLDKIERYEKLGFTSDYIHVALKEYIKGALAGN